MFAYSCLSFIFLGLAMSFRFDHLPGSGQIRLAGHFTGHSALSFLPAVRRTLPDYANHPLVIDMTEVDRIDTVGIGAMLVLHRDAHRQATALRVENCRQPVRELFRSANLERSFCIE